MAEMGLTFRKDMSLEDWEKLGHQLFRVETAWQWWIGDWINYGEQKWGETYKAAIEVTGRNYETLRRAASICREFEIGRRRPKLSFKHHVELQSLEPEKQDEILDQAEQEKLTTRQVRELVKGPPAAKSELERVIEAIERLDDDDREELKHWILED